MWWLWLSLLIVVGLILGLFLMLVVKIYRQRLDAFDSAYPALGDIDDGIQVRTISHGTVFSPTKTVPKTGVVYIPGGLVEARSYAPLCREIARRSGCAVVLLDAPMRIPTFLLSKIPTAMSALPDITRWVVGGHSIGGSVAGRYFAINGSKDASKEPLIDPAVVGLILHASYVGAGDAKNVNLSRRHDIVALQVLADHDEILTKENISVGKAALPENTVTVTIAGGNHAGFGHFGPQTFPRPDGVRAISLAEQQLQVADVTAKWLEAVDQGISPANRGIVPVMSDAIARA